MTLSLLLSIAGIAFVDSLNPSLFVAQFYLLTTPKPVGRILSYIAGVMTVNFIGGLLIMGGVRTLVGEVFKNIDGGVITLLQFGLGLALLGFGLWYKTAPHEKTEVKKPRSLDAVASFGLGIVVMLNEITTALPYFVAIEQISQASMSAGMNVLSLVGYNVIFSLPLFGFLGLFLTYRQRFAGMIERVNIWMQKWVPRLLKFFMIGLGGVLVVNAVMQYLGAGGG